MQSVSDVSMAMSRQRRIGTELLTERTNTVNQGLGLSSTALLSRRMDESQEDDGVHVGKKGTFNLAIYILL